MQLKRYFNADGQCFSKSTMPLRQLTTSFQSRFMSTWNFWTFYWGFTAWGFDRAVWTADSRFCRMRSTIDAFGWWLFRVEWYTGFEWKVWCQLADRFIRFVSCPVMKVFYKRNFLMFIDQWALLFLIGYF